MLMRALTETSSHARQLSPHVFPGLTILFTAYCTRIEIRFGKEAGSTSRRRRSWAGVVAGNQREEDLSVSVKICLPEYAASGMHRQIGMLRQQGDLKLPH